MKRYGRKIVFEIALVEWLGLAIVIVLLLFYGCNPNNSEKSGEIKIACVGNSITYGAGMVNSETNAYPAQLQELLGENYRVKNFGVNGATLLKKGDKPYGESDGYKEALAFNADIVFVKLGTNDSKQQNRILLDGFEGDMIELIESFKSSNPKARIVLLLPIPSFSSDSTGIWDPVIKERIIPSIQKVAYISNTEVIDLHQIFIDKPNLLVDKIHPSSLGASLISQRLYEAVVRNTTVENIDLNDQASLELIGETNFHGFPLTDFMYQGIACKLARPKNAALGLPWVLRARFWGHEPQTDSALLERGFHIAYCDVADLFGNGEAVARWNAFYELMTQKGLSKKVALEGMSRGGLIVYNWAVQNPEKVACIYADAPVLDGKSWPGGKYAGHGSSQAWKIFKEVYQITDEADLAQFKGNPIHKIEAIAKGGYPMLHVSGATDVVVPLSENTAPFVKGVLHHGGDITSIVKPNNGHHPHSLKNPSTIVNFILGATGQKLNFAVIPTPSAEYRMGAGWSRGADWWKQVSDIDSIIKTSKNIDHLLLGNSITQGFGANRPHFTYRPGKDAATSFFKNREWINAGIPGDRSPSTVLQKTFADQWSYVGIAVEEPGYTIWGTSPIAGDDGRIHLFSARWPGTTVDRGWRSHSEIAHYVGDSPEGPFEFSDIALKGTGRDTWDRYGMHNPNIQKVNDTYVLVYIANNDHTAPVHPSNQKIGMATSDSPYGPWIKVNKTGLILDVPQNPEYWNYKAGNGVNNPALLQHPYGGFYLYFKSEKGKMGLAVAENLEGPYVQMPFPVTKNDQAIEDGYAFMMKDTFCLLTTDNHGLIEKGGGILWKSEDGITFDQSEQGFYPTMDYLGPKKLKNAINHYSGDVIKFERPQVLLNNGNPAYLYVASGYHWFGGAAPVSYIFKFE